jgi:hypothetical protein
MDSLKRDLRQEALRLRAEAARLDAGQLAQVNFSKTSLKRKRDPEWCRYCEKSVTNHREMFCWNNPKNPKRSDRRFKPRYEGTREEIPHGEDGEKRDPSRGMRDQIQN